MPRKIIWAPLAESDLANIADYLFENWNVKTANQFVSLVNYLVNLISNNPNQFPQIKSDLNI